jgi:hypothetical protein
MEEEVLVLIQGNMKTVNKLLQEVNDTLGPEETEFEKDPKLKLNIPSGYIRTVYDFRTRLPCVKDKVLQYNIAYQLQLSDFFSWLLTRTNVSLTVREMLIKYGIVLMGSIAESLLVIFTTKNISFENKLRRLLGARKITQNTNDELKWLWDARLAIHPFELKQREYNKYKDEHFDRAVITVRTLLNELNRTCR